jgi:hypothetical protein
MVAFLTVDILRAHAMPVYYRDEARSSPRWHEPPALLCQRLAARWQIAPGGRLTCFWQVEAVPFVPNLPDSRCPASFLRRAA